MWGVLAFFLSFVPYIGLAIAMIPPTLLALAEFGLVQALIVVIGVTGINLLIENVLEPGYTGKRLSLSPTIVFLSLFFWNWLLGPVGALLSMPITVLLMLVFQNNEGTLWLAKIIGKNPRIHCLKRRSRQNNRPKRCPQAPGSEASVSSTEYEAQLGPVAQGFLTTTLELLAQFGMALFIFIFMISAALSLPGAARLGWNRGPVIGRIGVLTGDIRHYMTILTVNNFLVGLGDTVFLIVLGVDYALFWGLPGVVHGLHPVDRFHHRFDPHRSSWPMPSMVWSTALIVLLGYVLINGGVQNFVQPKMMGQGLKINPLVVFVGLFVWGFLLGGMGAILAVPLTVLVLTLMENFDATRMPAVLMRYTGEEKKEERQ